MKRRSEYENYQAPNLLSVAEVMRFTNMEIQEINTAIADDDFPRPMLTANGEPMFKLKDVRSWLVDRA